MTAITCKQDFSTAYDLTDWLVIKESDPSVLSQVEYQLAGRAFLLGSSLYSLAKAVGYAVLGALSFISYLFSIGNWASAKKFGVEQMENATLASSLSWIFLCGILAPKDFIYFMNEKEGLVIEPRAPLTPKMREHRIRTGADRIREKLQAQFLRAQNQAAQERDKDFQYLPAPEAFEATAHTEQTPDFEVGISHFIGRRDSMEDEHLVSSFLLQVQDKTYPVQLFGVFDGHGGKEASIYVRNNLEQVFHRTLSEFCKDGLTDEAIWNALKITFVRLNDRFSEQSSGTTATLAVILNGNVWTANVGDSRTCVDTGIQLSEDAKPRDPYYQRGIANRGGVVFFNRINGNLAVARAVGDHLIGAVSPRPKITVYPLLQIPEDGHLILTCDGIYDVSSTRQIARAVREHLELTPEQLAKNLVFSAYTAGSGDNLSAMIVRHKKQL